MVRTKADFRAERELTGMPQTYLAELMGVEPRSVRRWEQPDAPQTPPDEAWRIVDAARAEQLEIVNYSLDVVQDVEEEAGSEPDSVDLTLWPNQEVYDAAHPDEPGDYRMANANVELVAHEAEQMGYSVSLHYPS